MKKTNIFLILFASVLISVITSATVFKLTQKEQSSYITQTPPVKFTSLPGAPREIPVALDFTYAARVTTPGVVHVMSKTMHKQEQSSSYNPFKDLFGDDFFWGPQQPRGNEPDLASGSGVIVSSDGYIVTNNHVIKGADEIEVVTYDNKKFTAQLVGTDPSTDIAVIKIEQAGLPFIPFGNSDSVEIGSWVLAVGNPFNLSSTVTAGIVSAKGRNINILESQSAIESFIQTDAAVNPGNSGGALVDISGNLIGINTAIASPTGAFAGYSFAVPANLVRKVVGDLREFGIVQRGFLGVTIRNIDSDLAKDLSTEDLSGVYVEDVMEGSAADEAGLQQKDVIKTINGIAVNSSPTLQEVVAQYRPGDNLKVVYVRAGKMKEATIILKNKNKGTEYLTKAKSDVQETLGVEFAELTKKEINDLDINGGVKVQSIGDGRIKKHTDMRPGFIITRIDKQSVASAEDVMRILEDKKGGVMIEGVYPDYPGTYYYAFGM